MMGIHPSKFTFTYTQDVMVTVTKTVTRCCYGHALVIFNGRCYCLFFSITKYSFDF